MIVHQTFNVAQVSYLFIYFSTFPQATTKEDQTNGYPITQKYKHIVPK